MTNCTIPQQTPRCYLKGTEIYANEIICELVLPDKTDKETLLFEKYKKWMYVDCEIPQQVINN